LVVRAGIEEENSSKSLLKRKQELKVWEEAWSFEEKGG
jgi:hypothetical protein